MFDSPTKVLFVGFMVCLFAFFFGEVFGIDVFGAVFKYVDKYMP